MSKRKSQSKEDPINEPKVVALAGQSYSYGQTPAALCRQHFKEIAEHLNMTVEELARGVLNKSIGDQLRMLQDYYKSKNQETEAVYQPLLKLSYEEKSTPDKSQKKHKEANNKTGSSARRKKKSAVLVLSSESEPEEKMNSVDLEPRNKAVRTSKKPLHKRTKIQNMNLSRIRGSIEATIAFESTLDSEKEQIDKNWITVQEPGIADLEMKSTEVMPLNDSLSNEVVTEQVAKEPLAVIERVRTPGPEEESQEDLETFLYGKSPRRSKPPPRKKCRQQPPSQLTSETTTDIFDAFDSPSTSQVCTPGLAFESSSYSPSSRQRDLLSIARDIAAVQKVVASGKKLGDSVSDTIKFTNPTD
ncbi:hypothetical protein GHT06_010184 [Daphnia sinensis]|uniref:ERCC6L2-like ribbon-helix-helix domain-containing protein n=1 Tax=Daphnia sinensis TaxID=1820382 RepID=A0AAD5LIN0_9CRUS|nr:hypothetical protein GHT06_010184 [Daphnia sinensis]